ncbi:MAG: hypothetical protein ACO3FE_16920 [Planctomycetaceae bacterium]
MKKQTDGESVEIETPVAITQAADEASEESLIETEAEAATNDGYAESRSQPHNGRGLLIARKSGDRRDL